MPTEIVMPKLGLTMTEGLIVEWKKKEGDQVKKGEILFILETEKVTFEVECPEDGVLAKIVVQEKDTVPIGTVVAYLLRPGEILSDLKEVKETPIKEEEKVVAVPTVEVTPIHPGQVQREGRVKASPYAKKIAKSYNIDISSVHGSGLGGRIHRDDVERAHEQIETEVLPGSADTMGLPVQKLVRFTGMRRAIAKKMLAAKVETAQTYMSNTVDATRIMEYRETMLPRIQEKSGVRLTITDIMMKIAGEAIRHHPIINTRWTSDGVSYLEDVHMGMAMALDEGLIVPVIRDINRKSLEEVAKDRVSLIKKGRENKFLPDDITGSTFTLSAMGMFGIEQFTANINVPESAILAVGAIIEKPVVVNGEVKINPMINITLSYDHRIIDGAEAGKFMRTLESLIRNPDFLYKQRIFVIGGGVGGYPAAITAARLGAEVTLIERDLLGGTCLNWGCIPTKALLHSGEVLRMIKEAEVFGIKCGDYTIDFQGIMNRKTHVVQQLRSGVEKLLNAKKIRVIKGTASLVDSSTVEILETGEKIKSDKIIIATGSKPKELPIEGADGPSAWDSNEFLEMKTLPQSAVIIGGGVIGVEFAQILKRMGTDVTILELMDSLVPGTDKEIALALQQSIVKDGIKVFTGAAVKRIGHEQGGAVVFFDVEGGTREIMAEKVVISVGRKPDLSLLNVDNLGLEHKSGFLVVNERMETNIPNIYAVGDVVGGFMLAHVATAEGECAAKNAVGQDVKMNYRAIPSCIYTSPEVASVGLSEEEASKDFDVNVGRFPFHGCGKALVLNQTYGMVKIISERKSNKVLGVHIIGPHATDMIAEAVLGITMEMTAEDLAQAVHPHPTLSETVMESAMSLCGGAIHIP